MSAVQCSLPPAPPSLGGITWAEIGTLAWLSAAIVGALFLLVCCCDVASSVLFVRAVRRPAPRPRATAAPAAESVDVPRCSAYEFTRRASHALNHDCSSSCGDGGGVEEFDADETAEEGGPDLPGSSPPQQARAMVDSARIVSSAVLPPRPPPPRPYAEPDDGEAPARVEQPPLLPPPPPQLQAALTPLQVRESVAFRVFEGIYVLLSLAALVFYVTRTYFEPPGTNGAPPSAAGLAVAGSLAAVFLARLALHAWLFAPLAGRTEYLFWTTGVATVIEIVSAVSPVLSESVAVRTWLNFAYLRAVVMPDALWDALIFTGAADDEDAESAHHGSGGGVVVVGRQKQGCGRRSVDDGAEADATSVRKRYNVAHLCIAHLALTAAAFAIAFGCTVMTLERAGNPGDLSTLVGASTSSTSVSPDAFTAWNSLYFAVVSLTTVGYGDIAPDTALGRLATAIFIVTGLIYSGELLAAVVDLVHSRREAAAADEAAAELAGSSSSRAAAASADDENTAEGANSGEDTAASRPAAGATRSSVTPCCRGWRRTCEFFCCQKPTTRAGRRDSSSAPSSRPLPPLPPPAPPLQQRLALLIIGGDARVSQIEAVARSFLACLPHANARSGPPPVVACLTPFCTAPAPSQNDSDEGDGGAAEKDARRTTRKRWGGDDGAGEIIFYRGGVLRGNHSDAIESIIRAKGGGQPPAAVIVLCDGRWSGERSLAMTATASAAIGGEGLHRQHLSELQRGVQQQQQQPALRPAPSHTADAAFESAASQANFMRVVAIRCALPRETPLLLCVGTHEGAVAYAPSLGDLPPSSILDLEQIQWGLLGAQVVSRGCAIPVLLSWFVGAGGAIHLRGLNVNVDGRDRLRQRADEDSGRVAAPDGEREESSGVHIDINGTASSPSEAGRRFSRDGSGGSEAVGEDGDDVASPSPLLQLIRVPCALVGCSPRLAALAFYCASAADWQAIANQGPSAAAAATAAPSARWGEAVAQGGSGGRMLVAILRGGCACDSTTEGASAENRIDFCTSSQSLAQTDALYVLGEGSDWDDGDEGGRGRPRDRGALVAAITTAFPLRGVLAVGSQQDRAPQVATTSRNASNDVGADDAAYNPYVNHNSRAAHRFSTFTIPERGESSGGQSIDDAGLVEQTLFPPPHPTPLSTVAPECRRPHVLVIVQGAPLAPILSNLLPALLELTPHVRGGVGAAVAVYEGAAHPSFDIVLLLNPSSRDVVSDDAMLSTFFAAAAQRGASARQRVRVAWGNVFSAPTMLSAVEGAAHILILSAPSAAQRPQQHELFAPSPPPKAAFALQPAGAPGQRQQDPTIHASLSLAGSRSRRSSFPAAEGDTSGGLPRRQPSGPTAAPTPLPAFSVAPRTLFSGRGHSFRQPRPSDAAQAAVAAMAASAAAASASAAEATVAAAAAARQWQSYATLPHITGSRGGGAASEGGQPLEDAGAILATLVVRRLLQQLRQRGEHVAHVTTVLVRDDNLRLLPPPPFVASASTRRNDVRKAYGSALIACGCVLPSGHLQRIAPHALLNRGSALLLQSFFRRIGEGGRPPRVELRLACITAVAWGALSASRQRETAEVSFASLFLYHLEMLGVCIVAIARLKRPSGALTAGEGVSMLDRVVLSHPSPSLSIRQSDALVFVVPRATDTNAPRV